MTYRGNFSKHPIAPQNKQTSRVACVGFNSKSEDCAKRVHVQAKLSHKSCYTSGGKCSTTNTIYVAECTRHSMIYVGQSSQKLNSRFNGHKSDVKVKPKACELSLHFHNHKECSIDRDLKVYILQDNKTGSWEKREYFEDRWITRLNSKEPNGMNSNLKEFAKTFYALF